MEGMSILEAILGGSHSQDAEYDGLMLILFH